jgi:hypothetical protein
MSRYRTFFSNIVLALAAPATLMASNDYPQLKGSDLERMRGDVGRIGSDFERVLEREQGKIVDRKPSA